MSGQAGHGRSVGGEAERQQRVKWQPTESSARTVDRPLSRQNVSRFLPTCPGMGLQATVQQKLDVPPAAGGAPPGAVRAAQAASPAGWRLGA